MRRTCPACGHRGIPVGRIVSRGPPVCGVCGAEFEYARHAAVPQWVAIGLAAAFGLAWLTGRLDPGVALALAGAWIAFELGWDLRAPLRRREPRD